MITTDRHSSDPLDDNITIHVMFERGKSFWEYIIMAFQVLKLKRNGWPFMEVFSHVSIRYWGQIFQTHPAHGVIENKYEEGSHPERREQIEVVVDGSAFWMRKYQADTYFEKKYNYRSVLFLGLKILTDKWFGSKEPKSFNCATYVAYMLQIPNWWECDMIDIYRYVESENKAQKSLRMENKSIIEIAHEYIGEKEIAGNQGFYNKNLQQLIEATGWKEGWSYCMLSAQAFVEVYLAQFDSTLVEKYRKCFTPSVHKTYNNFADKYPEMVSRYPERESIAIFLKYKNGQPDYFDDGKTIKGHAGIVEAWDHETITTIDGNTNVGGSRNGDGFYFKTRAKDYKANNGLRLVGFIKFKHIYDLQIIRKQKIDAERRKV